MTSAMCQKEIKTCIISSPRILQTCSSVLGLFSSLLWGDFDLMQKRESRTYSVFGGEGKGNSFLSALGGTNNTRLFHQLTYTSHHDSAPHGVSTNTYWAQFMGKQNIHF